MSLNLKSAFYEPAYKLGKRVRKVALLPRGLRKLTGKIVPGPNPELPRGSTGTVIEICTGYIRVQWDGLMPMPEGMDPILWCCYDPVEQMICIQPLDN